MEEQQQVLDHPISRIKEALSQSRESFITKEDLQISWKKQEFWQVFKISGPFVLTNFAYYGMTITDTVFLVRSGQIKRDFNILNVLFKRDILDPKNWLLLHWQVLG